MSGQSPLPNPNNANALQSSQTAQVDAGNSKSLMVQANEVDYNQRKGYLGGNTRKVSLVGNYTGTGVWGDTFKINGSVKPQDNMVIFPITPQLNESGQVLKVDEGNIRRASSVIVYLGSPSRTFNIAAEFVSRTPAEATATFKSLNILKSWRMPMSDFNEPETVRLFAYDGQLKGIPCLMTSLNIEWPKDVDYIVTTSPTRAEVPIIQQVSLSLTEIRNYDDVAAFDYVKFKQGLLDQW